MKCNKRFVVCLRHNLYDFSRTFAENIPLPLASKGVALSALPPSCSSKDLLQWLDSQNVKSNIAQTLVSQIGIQDHEVLLSCIDPFSLRAELLSIAKEKLLFGSYAMLRRLLNPDPHNNCSEQEARLHHKKGHGCLLDILKSLLRNLAQEFGLASEKLPLFNIHSNSQSEVGTEDGEPENGDLRPLPTGGTTRMDSGQFEFSLEGPDYGELVPPPWQCCCCCLTFCFHPLMPTNC